MGVNPPPLQVASPPRDDCQLTTDLHAMLSHRRGDSSEDDPSPVCVAGMGGGGGGTNEHPIAIGIRVLPH
jgi:hypothetical protein